VIAHSNFGLLAREIAVVLGNVLTGRTKGEERFDEGSSHAFRRIQIHLRYCPSVVFCLDFARHILFLFHFSTLT
jgi:hypothetical protein